MKADVEHVISQCSWSGAFREYWDKRLTQRSATLGESAALYSNLCHATVGQLIVALLDFRVPSLKRGKINSVSGVVPEWARLACRLAGQICFAVRSNANRVLMGTPKLDDTVKIEDCWGSHSW